MPWIQKDTLTRIASSSSAFQAFVTNDIYSICVRGARLAPRFSHPRLFDTYRLWIGDLDRIEDHSFSKRTLDGRITNGHPTPDHFKQAAHLAYWFRRQAPVIEYESTDDPWASNYKPMTSAENFVRTLLSNYSSEYLGFDLGYRLCWFYEVAKLTLGAANPAVQAFYLDQDYIQAMCCFLKEKNVSPHALYLIYKSIFYKRFTD